MSVGVTVIIVSFVWASSEIALGRLRHSGAGAAKRDEWSLRLLWSVITLSIVSGIVLSIYRIGAVHVGDHYAAIGGLTLILMGLAIRWAAILTLRKYFTVDVAIRGDHQLVDAGLYRVLRHPAYSGSLLSFLGLGLTFSNWLSLLVIFVPIAIAFVYRIRVEERALAAFFGDRYTQYCASTKRLIPLIY